jgi:hypothetical protein
MARYRSELTRGRGITEALESMRVCESAIDPREAVFEADCDGCLDRVRRPARSRAPTILTGGAFGYAFPSS